MLSPSSSSPGMMVTVEEDAREAEYLSVCRLNSAFLIFSRCLRGTFFYFLSVILSPFSKTHSMDRGNYL